MPFRSQAQWKWAFATDQPFAKEWARMTPGGKRKFIKLAKRVGTKKAIKEFTGKSDGYSPPQGARSAARRGLELRREFGRGGTLVGVARARDLSNGKSISRDTIKRMVSFFARHSVDKRPDWSNPSNPTNGYIAHLLWGGDAGRSWANKISRQIDSAERTKADETRDGKPVKYEARAGEVITGNLGRDAQGRFTRVGGSLRQQIAEATAKKKPKKGGKPKKTEEQIQKDAESTLDKAGITKSWYNTIWSAQDEPVSADAVKDDAEVQELLKAGFLENVDGIITASASGSKLIKAAESGKVGRVQLVVARAKKQQETAQARQQEREARNQERIQSLDDRIESLVERYDSAKSEASKTRIARTIMRLTDKRDKLKS